MKLNQDIGINCLIDHTDAALILTINQRVEITQFISLYHPQTKTLVTIAFNCSYGLEMVLK